MAAAVAYVPLVFMGYGADVDSYLVVETGERLVGGGSYVPSRPPGFLVYEVAASGLDWLGGSVATNLGSLVAAVAAVAGFLALCRRFGVPHRVLLGLTFAFHPFVWVNAASTMDYLWALAFGLWGGAVLLDRRWVGAGVLFALAVGTRLTSALFIGGFLLYALWQYRSAWCGVVTAGAVTAVLGGLSYVPAIAYFGGLEALLTPTGVEEHAAWSWFDRVGRFGYKNVYLWGLPAALALTAGGVWAVVRRPRVRRVAPLVLAGGVVLGYEAFFLRYPLEQEYLLPIVPFVLIGAGLVVERRWLVAVCALVLAYNVVSINLARPDRPNHATSAEVGVWVEPGYLLTDVGQRLRVRGCASEACWAERSNDGTFSGRAEER